MLTAALALVIAVATACSTTGTGSSSEGSISSVVPGKLSDATLTVATTGPPPTLDPHKSSAYLTQMIDWHICEGLFTINKDYEAVPMLASSSNYSKANHTFTVKLRKGVKFQDGSGLDSKD
ncbi:MAG: ABC transporter substrate-binding protein, partial [Nocardioidaceae bacterium]